MARKNLSIALLLLLASTSLLHLGGVDAACSSTSVTDETDCTAAETSSGSGIYKACEKDLAAGAACTACNAAFTTQTGGAMTNCGTCTYATAAGQAFVCTGGKPGYFVKAGATYACDSVQNGGLYACSSCSTSATTSATCSAGSSSATTVDTTTKVVWFTAGATQTETKWCSKELAGCKTCPNSAAPTAATCTAAHVGWTWVSGTAPAECPDALCVTCTQGSESTSCLTYWGDSAGTASSTANTAVVKTSSKDVITLYQYDNFATAWTATATTSLAVTALTCATGSSLIGTTACFPCNDADFGVTGASTCTFSTAGVITVTACASGYVITSGTTPITCVKCGDGASTCTIPSAKTSTSDVTNTACADGYYLSSGACVACSIANALTCTGATAVTTCAAGYFPATTVCTACNTGIKTCTAAATATSCKDGYYYNAGASTCTAATPTPGCATYTSATVCSVAADGYFISKADGTAVTACADTNAKTCTQTGLTTGGFSLTCKTGYFLSNGVCTAYPTGCATVATWPDLTYAFKTKVGCLTAKDGYYISANSQPAACPTGSTACSLTQGSAWVDTCAAGYTRTAGTYSSTTSKFTFPACVKNASSNSLYLAASYIALAFMLVLALF